ncbi:hypothetical protein HZH66_015031 [Vespula vulgaris]|uniref:Uncharacterized protein n=1 Tax=Vespula vulgaris TaxID=7454 RepID=A0A834MM05_VESVU|nr:hypothetical protein HZH66_015031 [Vespula vulgaris]
MIISNSDKKQIVDDKWLMSIRSLNMYVRVRLGHETESDGYRKPPEARWNSEMNFQPRNRVSLTTNEVMLSNFDNG